MINDRGFDSRQLHVRNTGVLGITPFLSNGNRFTLSSQLLLGIVRDFL